MESTSQAVWPFNAPESVQTVARYDVIDVHTGATVRQYQVSSYADQGKQRRAASRYADKRDLAYGAVRYSVRPVWI